jgi:hypothetical protein
MPGRLAEALIEMEIRLLRLIPGPSICKNDGALS